MIHHLRFFLRVFLKDKFFSILNILGLALGIGVSIILLLILQNDLTYDRYHVNHERIYRLGAHLEATGVDIMPARTARELGGILKEELPEIEEIVRANSWDHTLVSYKNAQGQEVSFYEEDIVRTDSTYFKVFSHNFIVGDPTTCLSEEHTVVLTESAAKKYFGDEDPINKVMNIGEEQWTVTAVIEDVPGNTHLKFDILISRLIDREWVNEGGSIKSEAFWNPDVYMYIMFNDNQYDTRDFMSKFEGIYEKYFKTFGDQVGGKYTPVLEPLADVHFHSRMEADEPHGNIAYLYAFSGIGVFIILLACINYMNLSTAKSVKRAGEIAMKKTLGSSKATLAFSFLGESIFLSLISLVFAVALVKFVLLATPFNTLIGKQLTLDYFNNPILLIGSLIITVMIGFISGLYPAFYLPRVNTITALKGAFKNRKSSHTLRKILITAQFSISIFVVVSTLFMKQQIAFMRNNDLGFDKENIVLLPIQDSLVQAQIEGIKTEFLKHPQIKKATTSYNVMGINVGGSVMWAEGAEGMKQQAFSLMFVGEDYINTMGMTLLSGRDFYEGKDKDVDNVFIANEAAAKLMGWGDQAVGKKVKFFHGKEDGQVIGLVKNFNFNSLHNEIEPMLIMKARDGGGFLHLKVSGENLPETMAHIESKWKTLDPNHPYEYSFLDQRFDEQYRADEVQSKLLSALSFICIFISLLGLLGLSAFSASQRTKEIGVRKVHGASTPSIIYLLFKDIMLLVIIASIVVIPMVYYVVQYWMQDFAYQTELNYFLFLIVGVLALLFAFLTVAFHSLKTARTNPVNALKCE
ncbi:ABC transporter permease [Pseudochryseolinea flava]|uniref:ABC transporter permease n=1 Tax=Pseudochryseolinea flava TaxID=2059302 RepID=A0A364Y257_9BACT|nr:ABC transporter permease [Pseudochryseolinea flava]RAW00955.1 hypothetical protein DQQ10_11995 [Pseudochryseolinea flava]